MYYSNTELSSHKHGYFFETMKILPMKMKNNLQY